jgi:hypothetical protein
VFALTLTGACTGVVEGPGGGGTVPGGMIPGGGTPIDPEVAKTQPIDPGYTDIHRLNSAEYNATVADVLGTTLQPATASWRGGELGGFDNMASVLGVDADQYQRYFEAAEALTNDVFASDALRAKILTCTTQDDQACIKTILGQTGLRIFRRPLTATEQTQFGAVYTAARAQGDDHTASVRLMVQALLSSVQFLYRIEFDPTPASTAKHALTAYELASRLSYFLWSSAPDDKLLAAAGDNSLTRDDVLASAVGTMLTDAKSNRLVSNFAGQWLGARRVVDHPTSPEVYSGWSPAIASAAAEEMYLYFNEFLRTQRPWTEFMTADLNFVNQPLAQHYGMPAQNGTALVRLENVNDGRKGFAGLAGFLKITSTDRRTSPTIRGKWLLLNLMCTHPPDPPANIPELEEETGGTAPTNVREALEQHRNNPACSSCHNLFDPFGLALEEYDGIGKFRMAYPDGTDIDPATEMVPSDAYPAGLKFSGLTGAADAVTQNPKFAGCVAEKLMTYSLGRPLTETDKPYLDVLASDWLKAGASPTLDRLIKGLVATETFRFRRGEGK